jgi:hypothetical protein
MGPPTHTPSPPLSVALPFQRPVPVSRQGSTCFALASSRGEVETTTAQSATHTPSLDPTPLLCEAKLSEAKLWPCPTHSLPHQAPRHTRPCSRLEGPCTGGPIKALGEGLENASRQDKRRGEERRGVLGRRKGLHVCTSPGRDTGDMGRARGHPHRTLQPLTTIVVGVMCLPGNAMCVCWLLLLVSAGCYGWWACEAAQFVSVCMDVGISV